MGAPNSPIITILYTNPAIQDKSKPGVQSQAKSSKASITYRHYNRVLQTVSHVRHLANGQTEN